MVNHVVTSPFVIIYNYFLMSEHWQGYKFRTNKQQCQLQSARECSSCMHRTGASETINDHFVLSIRWTGDRNPHTDVTITCMRRTHHYVHKLWPCRQEVCSGRLTFCLTTSIVPNSIQTRRYSHTVSICTHVGHTISKCLESLRFL